MAAAFAMCNGETDDALPVLLFTANVGSLFENYSQLSRSWFTAVTEVIERQKPTFVAFHFQELGGKRIDDEIVGAINRFNSDLCSKMFDLQFARGFVYFDDDMKEPSKYTALGVAYFVNETHPMSVYDHSRQSFTPCPLLTQVTTFSTKQPPGMLNRRNYCLKERYPADFTKAAEFRKGHVISRWRAEDTSGGGLGTWDWIFHEFNLVNVHLFHDQSNILALDVACMDGRSRYSDRRYRALRHTLQSVKRFNASAQQAARASWPETSSCSSSAGAALLLRPVGTFIFGDLNLRLSLLKFISQVQATHGAETEWVSACANSGAADEPCAQCYLPDGLHVRSYSRFPSTDPSSFDTDTPSVEEGLESDYFPTNNNDYTSIKSPGGPAGDFKTDFSFRSHLLSQPAFRSASANCSFDCDNAEVPGKCPASPSIATATPTPLLPDSASTTTLPLPAAGATKTRSYSTNSARETSSSSAWTSMDGNSLLPPDYSKKRTSSDSSELSQQEHVEYLDLVEKSSRRKLLCVKRKHFDWPQHADSHDASIRTCFRWLRQFDEEMDQFDGQLYEADIDFLPSYPRSEDVFSPDSFSRTRAPAWCDRVLMDGVAWAQMEHPQYDLAGHRLPTGDHKPVYLSFRLRASGVASC